jgi:hypothetical protein
MGELQSFGEISVASGKSWQMLNRQQTLIVVGFQRRSNAKQNKANTPSWN